MFVKVGSRKAASVRDLNPMFVPAAIAGAMLMASSATFALGGPHPLWLLPDYLGKALHVQIVAVLIFIFLRVASLSVARPDRPLAIVWVELRPKLPLLLLPVMIFPSFLAGFTATKSAIPRLVGFRFDKIFADIDALLLGQDAWHFAHAVIGPGPTKAIEYVYVWGWVAIVAYSKAMIPLFASRRFVGIFFAATLMTWFFGGFVGAYLLPAAGPTFVHLADPSLIPRFEPLKEHLAMLLPPGSPFLNGPHYLEEGIRTGKAYSGGGISAMPSMHIASVTLLVLAARGTRLLIPASLFAAVIFIGSIHAGYHYVVDAPVAVAIASACWLLAESLFPPSERDVAQRQPLPATD